MPRDGSDMPRGQPGNWRRWLPAAPPPAPGALALYGAVWGEPGGGAADGGAPGGWEAEVSGFAMSTAVQPGRAGLLRRPVSR